VRNLQVNFPLTIARNYGIYLFSQRNYVNVSTYRRRMIGFNTGSRQREREREKKITQQGQKLYI
jgi:hypothetical protein